MPYTPPNLPPWVMQMLTRSMNQGQGNPFGRFFQGGMPQRPMGGGMGGMADIAMRLLQGGGQGGMPQGAMNWLGGGMGGIGQPLPPPPAAPQGQPMQGPSMQGRSFGGLSTAKPQQPPMQGQGSWRQGY